MRLGVCGLALLAAFALPSVADASPEDIFGYGGRTSAMGATGTAHATGYETAWHNPALAASTRANKLTLGYVGGTFRLDAVGAGLPGRTSISPPKGFVIAAEIPVPLGGKLTDRVGLALSFYTPSDVIVRGRVLYPEKTQFPMLAERAQSVTLRGGVGADIGWGLKLGVGFAALAEIEGNVVAATDATGRVGTQVETQLVATYAPVLGASWELPKEWNTHLHLGLAYRGELAARFAVVIDGTKLSSLTIPLFNISGLAQYDPAQIAFEAARIDHLNILALQVAYKKWSAFPGVLEPSVVCSEGGAGACGLVPPTIPWNDTFAVRLGAEQGFALSRSLVLRARGGSFFETSPLPSSVPGSEAFDVPSKSVLEVPTRYFDSSRLGFTTGVGVALAHPLPIDLDLYTQVHLLLPRTVTSTGANDAVLSTGEASGHITMFGMTAGVKF